MKLMIASDIHGSAFFCEQLLQCYEQEKPERLILLGDLLYHGPRNLLPKEYDPQRVIELLNALQREILCVRGNCEAEVDQMVLKFPIMSESMLLWLDGFTIYAAHGHQYNEIKRPPVKHADIYLQGHTHVPAIELRSEYIYLNPGSVSIPKEGSQHSYLLWEEGIVTLKNMQNEILDQKSLKCLQAVLLSR